MNKQELVLVRWNEKRIKTLPVLKTYSVKKDITKEIKDKNKQISDVQKQINQFIRTNSVSKVKAGTIYLVAGINCIPKAYWEICKEHKAVQIDLEKHRLEEIVETDVEEKIVDGKKKRAEKKNTTFSEMSTKKKEEIIEDTVDIRTLNIFLKEESSPDIRVIIQDRIKNIKEAKTDENIDHPNGHVKTS